MPSTLTKTTTGPPAGAGGARLNNRGRPCTSAGRRNATAVGSGLGNGGVVPPGRYERRRDSVTHDIRHGRRFREQWRRVLDHQLATGDVHRTAHAVASALSTFSNDVGKNAWPSQAKIGEVCGVSASTVNRSVKVLRQIGLLEWDHQFRQVDGKPHATSNLYEFRIPDALGEIVGVKKRSRRLDDHQIPKPAELVPDWQRDIDRRAHAVALLYTAAQYQAAETELLDDLADRPVEQRTFAAATLNKVWRTKHPTPPLE